MVVHVDWIEVLIESGPGREMQTWSHTQTQKKGGRCYTLTHAPIYTYVCKCTLNLRKTKNTLRLVCQTCYQRKSHPHQLHWVNPPTHTPAHTHMCRHISAAVSTEMAVPPLNSFTGGSWVQVPGGGGAATVWESE